MTDTATEAVYGTPPEALATVGAGAVQLSPLALNGRPVEDIADGSLARMTILAPPGTLERRYILAHALRALSDDGDLIVLAPKTKGGSRLGAELAEFGCAATEAARRHHRICQTRRPSAPAGLEAAIAAGAPRRVDDLGLWTQPGVFSWDRIDPGSKLLLRHLSNLSGRGADLGCGVGVLARTVLGNESVASLSCIDIDRRAVDAARRNIDDHRAAFRQADVRVTDAALAELDFVVMNPPFHEGGQENRGLGLAFIARAAEMLRKGGVCRMVANIALPYEASLNASFTRTRLLSQDGGYKVYEAVK